MKKDILMKGFCLALTTVASGKSGRKKVVGKG
jgi:hypothetical protein